MDSSVANAAIAGSIVYSVIMIVIAVVALVAMWKIYVKAGKPGWAAIIPIYNIIVYLQIAGRPIWWIVLLLIPGVNVIIGIILCIDIAKCFGKSGVWGFFMLCVLSIIGILILAFGKAQYTAPQPKAA
jgi:hypothetical protein